MLGGPEHPVPAIPELGHQMGKSGADPFIGIFLAQRNQLLFLANMITGERRHVRKGIPVHPMKFAVHPGPLRKKRHQILPGNSEELPDIQTHLQVKT